MIKGMVGAVYENDTAPISDNIGLLLNWELEHDTKKEVTFGIEGPELHGIPADWHVKAQAYWMAKTIDEELVFIRLFIGKGADMRCLTGFAENPALQKTDEICKTTIKLYGIGGISCETNL